VLHDLISNALDFFYGEIFFDFPDSELEAHRDVVLKAGLSFPAKSERRIQKGAQTFEDCCAIYGVISAATEKIEVPSIFIRCSPIEISSTHFNMTYNVSLGPERRQLSPDS